ncbi:MFS transporter [Cerasicoccus arenae]|nr:MFS transporter [Cerasicoccus arenae]
MPFRPASLPFFYGWAIVAAGTGAMLFSLPGQTAGIGPFKEHMMAALHVSSMQLSIAYMIGTIVSGLSLPSIGGVFDRIGARKVGVMASIGLGLSLLYISQVDRIMFGILGRSSVWLAMPLIILGFFAIRFWGQGVFSIVSRAMIGKWFDRKRGIASAISGMPVAIAFTSALYILYKIIETMGGWRQAWIGMGLFVLFFSTVFCWLIFRDNPEECGLVMDGSADLGLAKAKNDEFVINREFTAREALRTMAFWVFSLTICINGFVGTAIGFHAQSLTQEIGMDQEAFYLLLASTIFINIPVSFIVGWMTSRFRLKYAYLVTAFGMALGMVGYLLLPSELGRILFLLGFGATWGSFGTLVTVTWPRYYGRRHLGKISSWVMMLMVVTSALGPVFFDFCKLLMGSYRPAFFISIGLSVIFFFLCFKTENPQRKYAKAAAES